MPRGKQNTQGAWLAQLFHQPEPLSASCFAPGELGVSEKDFVLIKNHNMLLEMAAMSISDIC